MIRGGEYMAADRADYGTALKVWSRTAQEGDPEAQYYVGTIYEKGPDGKPNYELALSWYRKAADKGYSRAAISLGRLYEQGLGIPKDPAEAFKWYAKASGLTESNLSMLMNQEAVGRVRVLEQRLAEKEQEIERLRNALASVQGELEKLRGQLKERSRSADDERLKLQHLEREYQALQARLNKAPEKGSEPAMLKQRAEALKSEIGQGQRQLVDRNEEVSRLQSRIATLEKAATRIQTLEQTVASRESEVQDLRAQLLASNQGITRLDEKVQERLRQMAEDRQKLQGAEQQYQRVKAELEQARSRPDQTAAIARHEEALRRLGQEVQQGQQRLEERDKEIARLQQKLVTLESEADTRSRQLEASAPVDLGFQGPTIEIIDPPLARPRGLQVVKKEVMRVPASAASRKTITGRVLAPAGLRSLKVNGEKVPVDENGIFTAPLPADQPGEEGIPVQILATDIQNKLGTLQFIIKSHGAAPVSPPSQLQDLAAFGKYYALVIGNDHYRRWPPLMNAISDAAAVAKVLQERYGYQVIFLKDANRQQLLKALNEYRKILTEQDNLLVYYAGHGHLETGIDRGYWIPVDADVDDNSNWIPLTTVTDLLQLITAKHVLVVADSCFSGKLTRSALAQLRPGLSEDARLEVLKTLARKRVRTAMTSGGVSPVLDAGGEGHSVFAQAFLGVLEDNTIILEAERFFWAVRTRVLATTKRLNVEQIPTYDPIHMAGHESLGDFIFIPARTM